MLNSELNAACTVTVSALLLVGTCTRRTLSIED